VGLGDRAIPLLDPNNRPHPSVLWYRGGDIIVGAEARSHLDLTEGGAPPGFVRSPKMALRREGPIHVDGREIDPTDAVSEVLKYLRRHAKSGARAKTYDVTRAVVTVPVDFGGPQRRALRAAARKAGIGVIQFVHEPVAALYAWIRAQQDWRKELERLEGRVVLVFDWGGGTLDLTLCRVQGGTIVQIKNQGDNEIGGDRFDERLRNLARERHAREHGVENVSPSEAAGMAARLLAQCEQRKVELSAESVKSATLFIRDYLRVDGPARNLNLKLSREDLERQSADLVRRGIAHIDTIIEEARLTYQDIELCLATGGMVNMPVIRNAVVERFGGRVPKLENGDRIIAEGAALIAHDGLRLRLAKPIEVLVSDGGGRGAYQELIGAGFELPVSHWSISPQRLHRLLPQELHRSAFPQQPSANLLQFLFRPGAERIGAPYRPQRLFRLLRRPH
jgi:molecular chaperone DnaK (HSP70)